MRRRKQATKRLRRKMTKIARRDAQTAVRGPSIAELQEQLDIRTRERNEALEQQAATAEVLKVISSSTGKLEPVFQTILENSITICEAKFGMFWLTEGHSFRCVALHGTSPAFTELRRREPIFHPNPTLLSPLGRIARSKQLVHVADCRAEQAYIEGDPGFVALVDLAGARTILVVPILRDNELVGALNIFRQEVRPFTQPSEAFWRLIWTFGFLARVIQSGWPLSWRDLRFKSGPRCTARGSPGLSAKIDPYFRGRPDSANID